MKAAKCAKMRAEEQAAARRLARNAARDELSKQGTGSEAASSDLVMVAYQ